MNVNDDNELLELLADNYACLHAMYRLGEFEGVAAVAYFGRMCQQRIKFNAHQRFPTKFWPARS